MKKLLLLALSLFVAMSLVACGEQEEEFEGLNWEMEDVEFEESDISEDSDTYEYESEESYDSADYNIDGEYQPVEDMTQEEIQAELEEMLEGSLGE
jgi:hypothetical protein